MQYPVQSLSPDVISSLLRTFEDAMADAIRYTQQKQTLDPSSKFVRVFKGVKSASAYAKGMIENWMKAPRAYQYLQNIYSFKTKSSHSKKLDDAMFFATVRDAIVQGYLAGHEIQTFGYFCGNAIKRNLAPLYHAFERISKRGRKYVDGAYNDAKIFMHNAKKKAKKAVVKVSEITEVAKKAVKNAFSKNKVSHKESEYKNEEPKQLGCLVNFQEEEVRQKEEEYWFDEYGSLSEEEYRARIDRELAEAGYVDTDWLFGKDYYGAPLNELISSREERRRALKQYGGDEKSLRKAMATGQYNQERVNGFR